MIKTAIVGVTGFSGQELQKILESHPQAEITYAVGRQWQEVGVDIDVVFLALPHGAATDIAPHFLSKGIRVIDLSADFRYKTDDLLSKIQEASPDFTLEQWAYSIPELHREKIDYSNVYLLANPGCYPTAALLGLAPLFCKDALQSVSTGNVPSIIIDAKSGYSGAGKAFIESDQFDKLKDNLWAYKIAGVHNHVREIEVQLGDVPVSFTPHIMPFYRGILETIYVQIPNKLIQDGLNLPRIYTDFYHGESFVKVVEDLPTVKDVTNTNNCHIAIKYDQHVETLIIISVIDNLIKGAAGQAMQNMNLMFGIKETEGLIY